MPRTTNRQQRSSHATAAAATTTTMLATTATRVCCMAVWLLPLLVLTLQQQPAECRYLPTRSHGDDLDKLRELMLQILESSNEEQRPPNEATGNTLPQRGGAAASASSSWQNKLGALDVLETPLKYTGGRAGMVYDNGRYY